MKQFHIPTLGEEITLAKDWTFTVINDHRNALLVRWMNNGELFPQTDRAFIGWHPLGGGGSQRDSKVPFYKSITATTTLPKGTRLKIVRIYIRAGQKDFDSLTFIAPDLKATQNHAKKSLRFFAKLDEVNQMVVES